MPVLTLTSFLERLRAYQILTDAQLREVAARQGRYRDARALARDLIRRDWLTPYQANQLLQGKGDKLVLGPYRLLERLGTGTTGEIFKARHVRMDRLVALKIIHQDLIDSPKAVERFAREARAVAQLAHPNIVVVHDADQVGDVHFLAMEYVKGTDLSRMVHRGGPLPIGQACDFARQAAEALQHAFERGVIHRDVKPGNLMVTRAGPDQPRVVKILDFGLARFESETGQHGRLTQVGHLVGTVDYIAPEQAENARTADTRSDVYALGCTLYFLLAGKPPFGGKNLVERLTARMGDETPSVRDARADVPAGLDRVLLKMMARDPERRYQTPGEVADALEPFARPDAAEPASPFWGKWWWLAVAAGILVVIALLLLFGPRGNP
jgi:eukaryotic-like serine/threonine-protein kinase